MIIPMIMIMRLMIKIIRMTQMITGKPGQLPKLSVHIFEFVKTEIDFPNFPLCVKTLREYFPVFHFFVKTLAIPCVLSYHHSFFLQFAFLFVFLLACLFVFVCFFVCLYICLSCLPVKLLSILYVLSHRPSFPCTLHTITQNFWIQQYFMINYVS